MPPTPGKPEAFFLPVDLPPIDGEPVVFPPDTSHLLRSVASLGQHRPILTTAAVYNDRGMKVLDKGVRVDASLYDRLVSHRLSAPLENHLAAQAPVDAMSLQQEALRLAQTEPFFGGLMVHARVREMLLQAMGSVPLPPPVAFSLTLQRDTTPSLFCHAVRMGLLCAHFVREAGGSVHDVGTAAAAGVLHDLGMNYIDTTLLESDAVLDPVQRGHLYVHPLTTAMLLQPHHVYPREMLRAILEHHEHLDGSGYPRGLSGSAISPLGRVLAISEVATSMLDGGHPHASARVSVMLRLDVGRYDRALAASLDRLLRAGGRPPAAPEADDFPDGQTGLAAVFDAMARWRALVAENLTAASPAQQILLAETSRQLEALERALSDAGGTPLQWEQLGPADRADPEVGLELSLLAREAAWQVRVAALRLRLRWRAQPAAPRLPAALHAWVRDADIGLAPKRSARATAAQQAATDAATRGSPEGVPVPMATSGPAIPTA